MPLFACSGYPDFEAGNARKAARFFADLRTKSEYGAGGECTFLAATPGSVLTQGVHRKLSRPWRHG
jgi:hypothetical protein